MNLATRPPGQPLHGGDDAVLHRVLEHAPSFVQQVMRHRFEQVVEMATGRKVVGFMSGNQQEPDMICEVFVLAPNPVTR